MKIMSPVNSLKTAISQIEAGADEIYVGLMDDTFKNLVFSGRGKFSNIGLPVNPDESTLKSIVSVAHQNNVTVNFTANTQHMVDSKGGYFEQKYKQYIFKGIEAGVDRLIVGDLGNLMLINELKIDIPLILSTFFVTFNSEAVKLFKSLNIKRVVLPHSMKLNEIKEIKESSNVEVEVFVGVNCSNIDGNCQLQHNVGENIKLGVPCKALYSVSCRGQHLEDTRFLDSSPSCSLCSLKKLYDANVDVLKITGRDQNPAFTAAMTKVHRQCVDLIKSGEEYTKQKIDEITSPYEWWKNGFCRDQRCRYKTNDISINYV